MTSNDSVGKTETYEKKQFFLPWLLVEPFKTALFRVTTKKSWLWLVYFDSFVIVLLSISWISTIHISTI